MDKHEIEVRIDADANVSVKVKGINGPSCTEVTKDIEKALGKTTDRKHTDEFSRAPRMGQQAKQH